MSIDPQDLEQLETDVQGMQWENVSLEPDTADVQQLDQELPAEWTTLAEQPEREEEYTPEELADLLDTEPELPEGDIDQNADQALQELDLDLQEIAQERDLDLDIDIDLQQGFDFGR